MTESIQERIKGWAEKLIDLSGRSDLISFRETKTSTIIPIDKAVKRLFKGESVLISDLIDTENPESLKGAKGVVKNAIENHIVT